MSLTSNRNRKLLFNVNNDKIQRGYVGVGLTNITGVYFDNIKMLE